MKWTNKQNLPEPIYNAIVNSDYSKGHADFSVTELGMPPQERRLFKDNHHLITKDVIDNIWALFGTSMHYILEKASDTSDHKKVKFLLAQLEDIRTQITLFNDGLNQGLNPHEETYQSLLHKLAVFGRKLDEILERQILNESPHLVTEARMYVKIASYVIGGQPDLYNADTMIIQDYKVTTVWKYMQKDKSQWETQLNCYRYLLTHNDKPVKGLQVVGIFKDWKAFDQYKENYPPSPVMVIDLPVQNDLFVLEHITKRLRMHEEVKGDAYSDPEKLFAKSPCSDADRWATKEFKVYKHGGKKSSKNVDTMAEAVTWVRGRTNEYSISDTSTYKKCDEYCDVKNFCAQHKKHLAITAGDETNITSAPTVEIPAETPTQKKGELSDYQKSLLAQVKSTAGTAMNKVVAKEMGNSAINTLIDSIPTKVETEKPMSALEKVRARNAEKAKAEAKETEVKPIDLVDQVNKVVSEEPIKKPEVTKSDVEHINDILKDLDLDGK